VASNEEILKALSQMATNAKDQAVLIKELKQLLAVSIRNINMNSDRIDALEQQLNAVKDPFSWPGLGH